MPFAISIMTMRKHCQALTPLPYLSKKIYEDRCFENLTFWLNERQKSPKQDILFRRLLLEAADADRRHSRRVHYQGAVVLLYGDEQDDAP
jgi:hypothetical protein